MKVGDSSPATFTFATNNDVCTSATTFSLKEAYSWISIQNDAETQGATISVIPTSNDDAGTYTVTLQMQYDS